MKDVPKTKQRPQELNCIIDVIIKNRYFLLICPFISNAKLCKCSIYAKITF